MKKKAVSLLLILALVLGLAVPAMAYTTPDFSDVPSNHWAYQSVMKMADAGVIKGTGAGMFSPDMKLSAEMFIVLVGRVVFPDVKAEGADWSGPYVAEAKAKGLLEGTNITDSNLKGDISRYDMAVILAKCVEILKVSATKADSSKVTDYGEVPTKYVDAVLMAYGSGLIRGDQSGSFNGANSMTRQEAATVMDRLLGLKGNGSQGGGTTEPETIHTVLSITCYKPEPYEINSSSGRRTIYSVPVELRYTEDGGKTSQLIAECTSYTQGTYDFVSLEADIDKALVDNENGQFYLSAETTYEGQKLVTHDRRTDGRATIFPIDVEVKSGHDWVNCDLDLVPPTGFKRNVTIEGHVHKRYSELLIDENGLPYLDDAIPNITVDLVLYRDATSENLKETDAGIIVGSAISGDDGKFCIETTVDTLDFGKRFRLEGHGEYDGQQWESTFPWRAELLNKLTTIVPNGMWLPDNSVQMEPVQ